MVNTVLINKLRLRGFSLIEMLVVLAIISILALMAMPNGTNKITRTQITENLNLVEPYKAYIEAFYRLNNRFPINNSEVALPEPEKIAGNYMKSAFIEEGAIHIVLGHKLAKKLHDQVITLRPITVQDSPLSPISWVCGYDQLPEGLVTPADNKTNVEIGLLPIRCR